MSGIYITGIEKSETCAFCHFCDGIADTQLGTCAYCLVDGKAREADTTTKDCPLIHVPEHGRLIDADAVVLDGGPYEYDEWCKWALDQYQDAPTIIPADTGR